MANIAKISPTKQFLKTLGMNLYYQINALLWKPFQLYNDAIRKISLDHYQLGLNDGFQIASKLYAQFNKPQLNNNPASTPPVDKPRTKRWRNL